MTDQTINSQLLGVVRTAQSEAARVLAADEDAGDLAQTRRDLPRTLDVIEHAVRTGRYLQLSAAAHDVLAERRRQEAAEGWSRKHDDALSDGSLALAAACYACNAATWAQRAPSLPEAEYGKLSEPGFRWPWHRKWWKPKSQRRDLVRAAALLLAEIERLDRVS